ncbi:Protein BOLA2 [Hibiscus syriacus]|uniref:Protein BOLA2 n=1 Tax=Hibiscus syriacus TaxID=106335 RepID=A0A6A2XLX4_HIBSY|nr:Protein BOLA2 [Hibiscus syriacus]
MGRGWWKATSHVKAISSANGGVMGYKRPLTFYRKEKLKEDVTSMENICSNNSICRNITPMQLEFAFEHPLPLMQPPSPVKSNANYDNDCCQTRTCFMVNSTLYLQTFGHGIIGEYTETEKEKMGVTKEQVESSLTSKLKPLHLVRCKFCNRDCVGTIRGKRLLERHRIVNAALEEELKQIHALDKKALTLSSGNSSKAEKSKSDA